MEIFDNIAATLGSAVAAYRGAVKGKVGEIPDWLSASADMETWQGPNMAIVENQEKLYAKLSWFNIAVGHLARQSTIQALNVKQVEGDRLIDIDNHPFEETLARPNVGQSRSEFIESWLSYRIVTGDGYAWQSKANENAPPEELWVIPSHRIKPVPDKRMYIKGYLYDTGDGNEIPIEPWEVVHLKAWNPFSPYTGLSAVEALAVVAEGDMAMQRWNTGYFSKDNAKISGILAYAEPIPDAEWSKMQDDAKTNYGGTKRRLMMMRNAGKGGVEWISTSMSQKDMEFLAARDFNKEEIYAMVAPGFASWLDVNSTEANSKTGKEAFMELAVWPLLKSVGEKITNDILPSYGEGLLAEFDDPRVKDRAMLIAEQGAYAETHTVEEIREKFYGDDPLGDERDHLLPSELSSSGGFFEEEEEEPEEPEEEDIEAKAHERQQFRRFAEWRKGKPEEIKDFRFSYLDPVEQAALKSEYAADDSKVLVELTRAIDVLRESNGRKDADIFGKAIADLGRKVDEKSPITVNVAGQEAPIVNVPEQKPPVVNNEIKIPKPPKQIAPVIKVEVKPAETQVIIKEDKGEEVVEVERGPDGKLKKLTKRKK